jgi:hypothetical protein
MVSLFDLQSTFHLSDYDAGIKITPLPSGIDECDWFTLWAILCQNFLFA